MPQSVLFLGGAGAQNTAVVQALLAGPNSNYQISLLTRSTTSRQAKELAAAGVTLIEGDCFDAADLRRAFKGIDSCYVNLNGFATGEMNELHWSVRIYEIAIFSGVKHFVFGAIDYCSKKAGFDPKYHCGHYDGKGRFIEYLKAQPTEPMNWSVLCSGPYIDMLHEVFNPHYDQATGEQVFTLPIGEHGAMPYIVLEDLGRYGRWIFDHPTEAKGLNLEIATCHATGGEVAAAYTAATGKPARYDAAELDEYMRAMWAHLPQGPDTLIGADFAGPNDKTLQTWGADFTAWFEIYRSSGGNKGIVQRDYDLLDKILPDRIRSVEEWMRKVGFTGEKKSVLKGQEDRASKK